MIEAQSFNLVDEAGKPLATLGVAGGGPRLRFLDKKAKTRVSVGFDEDRGPLLGALDENETPRVYMTQSDLKTGLIIRDANDKIRIALDHCPECASLFIGDEKGNRRIETGYKGIHTFSHVTAVDKGGGIDLVSDDDKSFMVMVDKDRHKRLALAQETGGGSGIHIYDENGVSKITIDNDQAGPCLDMIAPRSNAHVAIGTDGNRPTLGFYDEKDRARMVLQVSNPWASMVLYDASETVRGYVAASSEQAQVVLCDEINKSTWQAPPAADTKGDGFLPVLLKEQRSLFAGRNNGENLDDKKSNKLELGPIKFNE